MIPEFTEEGLLPPGVYETDLKELKEKMGWSRKGRGLIGGLEEALDPMASCGVVRAYLDGSFVTDKDRPNDVDGCYHMVEDATAEDLGRVGPYLPTDLGEPHQGQEDVRVGLLPGGVGGVRERGNLLRVFPDRPAR